jgi:hypothetical protein
MKFAELKARVYECWEDLSVFNGAIVQPENFRSEVREFGDLRYKETWKKAYCSFVARNMFDANSDNRSLVRVEFNFYPHRWDWELRHQIIDEFLSLPDGLECIIDGLEDIFRHPLDREEKEIANGVFELVKKQCRGNGRISVGSIWRLAGN